MASRSKKIQAQLAKKNFMLRGMRKPVSKLDKGAAFQGLLDLFPGAAFATGMRLLRADYSGGILRIIAYDGASQQGAADIMPYKIGNEYWVDYNSKLENLDATATGRGLTTNDTLADLCSVGVNNYDGLVPSWYDQSLNANHATQTSLAAMPKLVDAGVLEFENGKPCMDKTTAQSFLLTNNLDLRNIDSSQIYVYRKKESGKNDSVGWSSQSSTWGMLDYDSSNLYAYGAGNNITKDAPFRNNTNQKLFFGRCEDAIEISIYEDSNLVGSITSLDMARIEIDELFGGITNSNFTFQESIIYFSDQNANRTGIQDNINNAYNIY